MKNYLKTLLRKHLLKEEIEGNNSPKNIYLINEITLNRIVLTHMNDGMIIISPYRSCKAEKGGDDCTEEELQKQKEKNKNNNKQIKIDIRNSGFSFIPVYGGYKEKTDKGDVEVLEPGYVLPAFNVKSKKSEIDKLKLLGIELSKKYNQDSFLFKSPGKLEITGAYFVDKNGKEEIKFTNISVNNMISKFFTKLIGSKKRADRRFSLMEEKFSFYLNEPPYDLNDAKNRYGEIFYRL